MALLTSRRQFVKRITALSLAPGALLGAGAKAYALSDGEATSLSAPIVEDAPPPGAPEFFTSQERLALGRIAESILPGASSMGVVAYIENLTTAFEFTPPRIYAGGPFSGRQPFAPAGAPKVDNDFVNFLPLNRVQERAWRLYLYGSAAVPGGNPNEAKVGPIHGLRDVLKDGLKHAFELTPTPIHELDEKLFGWLWNLLHEDFKNAMNELVIEGAFSAPEYGGNRQQAGWELAHFPGDTLPAGYSQYRVDLGGYTENRDAPVSERDPGADPDPLSFFTRMVFRLIALVIGRNFA